MFWKNIKKPDPKKEQEKVDELSQEEISWKDRLAMVFSAYLVIGLPCVLILIILAVVMLWLSGAL